MTSTVMTISTIKIYWNNPILQHESI